MPKKSAPPPPPPDPSPIPLTGVIQDSWAWHPDSKTRGMNFVQVHVHDEDHADYKVLIKLASWLFAKDAQGEFPNLPAFQKRLEVQFKPDDKGAAANMNEYLAKQAALKPDPPQLSHAQFVQLYHVLIQQEDVRLVAPRKLEALSW